MAEKFTPVVFNEGAPLEPSKLNDLQNNLSSLVQDVGGLKNATAEATYTVVMDCGFESVDLVANTMKEVEVRYNAAIFTGIPQITMSVGSAISATTNIEIGLKDSTTKPTIQILSAVNRSGFKINWIATEKKFTS